MSRAIPTINTARVTLRAMRAEDFTRFADIWATPEVVRFIGGKPWPKPRAWDAFLRNAGHWQITGFGQWAVQVHGHGQGVALDATKAAHEWFDRIIAGPTVCMIDRDHAASLHLAETLGYRPMRMDEYEGEWVQLMKRKGPVA